jgi:hypothetical protein
MRSYSTSSYNLKYVMGGSLDAKTQYLRMVCRWFDVAYTWTKEGDSSQLN